MSGPDIDKTDFERGHRFELSTSTALKGKAPAGFDWASYYRTFQRAVMTPRELAIHIWRGYAFTPVWKRARREENFIGGGHVALDFDAGDETSSLGYLMRDGTFAWMFASFGYSTPGSTETAPRSRLVFVLEYPIDDAAEYRAVYQAVAWAIARDGGQTDPACKDPLRLYYGSPNCTVAPNWSVLGKGTIDHILGEYEAAHPPQAQPEKLRIINPSPSEAAKSRKLAAIGLAVRNAPKGEGHTTLLKRAREAGGYVASGAFSDVEVLAELTAAAMARPWSEDAKEIERVIRDGINNGMAAPLYFESAPPIRGMLK